MLTIVKTVNGQCGVIIIGKNGSKSEVKRIAGGQIGNCESDVNGLILSGRSRIVVRAKRNLLLT